MSNVIDFIERLGQDARLRDASPGELELALAQAQLDPEVVAAILARDQRLLDSLLGGAKVYCALMPGKQDEEEEEDESEEAPSHEDAAISPRDACHVVGSVR